MPGPSSQANIFISYARHDGKIADMLQERLMERRVQVWVDRTRLIPGAPWPIGLQQALDSCDTMLVLLSPSSLGSEAVRREYIYALRAGKTVIPVLIAPVTAFPQELRFVQWVDLTQKANQGYFDLLLALDARGWKLENVGAVGYDWELALARATRHQLPEGYHVYWVPNPRWYTRGLFMNVCLAVACASGAGAMFNYMLLRLLENSVSSLLVLLVPGASAAIFGVVAARCVAGAAQWWRQRLGKGVPELIVTTPEGFIMRTLGNPVGTRVRVLTYRGASRLTCSPFINPRIVWIVIRSANSPIRRYVTQYATIPARFMDTATIALQISGDFDQYQKTHSVEDVTAKSYAV